MAIFYMPQPARSGVSVTFWVISPEGEWGEGQGLRYDWSTELSGVFCAMNDIIII